MHPKDWLGYYGSLTEKMQQVSTSPIRVKVKRQGRFPVFADERALLVMPEGHWAWVREIELFGNDRPWLLARTVIPFTTLQGKARRLTLLGNRPLGPVLFNRLGAQRQAIEFNQVEDIPWQDYALPHALWCRQSLFRIQNSPLLLRELFLPDNPVYQD